MKPTKISELLDKTETPDGMVVKCVEGTLISLYKENTGEGQYGPWALQNGSIKDDSGETIKIVFSNCSQPIGAKGKKIKISSTPSDKHGLQGVKVNDVEAKDKFPASRQLKVTSTAEIIYEGGAPSGATTKSGPAQTETQKSYPSQRPNDIVRDVLALHDHCDSVVREHYRETPDEETVRAYVASVFIESCKQNASLNYIMREGAPTSKIEDNPDDGLGKEEKSIVDQNNLFPADWPEAIIPGGSMKGKTLKEIPDDKLVALFEHYDSKSDNSPFAECCYLAAHERGVIPKGSKKEQDDLP